MVADYSDTLIKDANIKLYDAISKEILGYVKNNLRYPDDATKMNISGKVIATFIVAKDGTIENIKIDKAIYPSLDREVFRVLNKLNRVTNDTNKNIFFKIPVDFSLGN